MATRKDSLAKQKPRDRQIVTTQWFGHWSPWCSC